MDIAAEPLVLITDYARKIVAQNGFKTKIESTTKPARKHWMGRIMY